jgi:hypothetical protein
MNEVAAVSRQCIPTWYCARSVTANEVSSAALPRGTYYDALSRVRTTTKGREQARSSAPSPRCYFRSLVEEVGCSLSIQAVYMFRDTFHRVRLFALDTIRALVARNVQSDASQTVPFADIRRRGSVRERRLLSSNVILRVEWLLWQRYDRILSLSQQGTIL